MGISRQLAPDASFPVSFGASEWQKYEMGSITGQVDPMGKPFGVLLGPRCGPRPEAEPGGSMRNLQIREVPFRAVPHSQGDVPLRVAELYILTIRQGCAAPWKNSRPFIPSVLRPCSRFKVQVRFVILGRLLPQPVVALPFG